MLTSVNGFALRVLGPALRYWPGVAAGLALAIAIVGLAAAAKRIDAQAEARGQAAADARWRAAAEAESARQRLVSAMAVAEHTSRVAALETQRDQLAAQLMELGRAAAQDPTADRECLGPDSVRRLNGIAAPKPRPAAPREPEPVRRRPVPPPRAPPRAGDAPG